MKLRNGFVSNSSSSSFIVTLPRKPLTLDGVADYLGLTPNEEINGERFDAILVGWFLILNNYVDDYSDGWDEDEEEIEIDIGNSNTCGLPYQLANIIGRSAGSSIYKKSTVKSSYGY